MTDDNRNASHPEGSAHKSRDPLLELTRLFNLDFNANEDNPAGSATGQNVNDRPQSGGPDDADLSFLDPAPQEQSTQNTDQQTASVSATPQNIDNDLDFLPNDARQQPASQEREPDLPFNELYDVPSFTPQARSFGTPVETPAGFENEQFDLPPVIPMGNEPALPVDEQSPNYSSKQNHQLPEDFDFIPEQDLATPQSQNVDPAFKDNQLTEHETFSQSADGSNSTASAIHVSSHSSSPMQVKAPMQQYPAFDEMLFDKELENLLVNAPLVEDDETNVPLHERESFTAKVSNETASSQQQNLNQYAVNKPSFIDQSQVFNPASQAYNPDSQLTPNLPSQKENNAHDGYSQQTGNNSAPLPYTPPASHQTTDDKDFLIGIDPLAKDDINSNSPQLENAPQVSHAPEPAATTSSMTNVVADPFGLEDLSTEENVIVNPPVYPDNSAKKFQSNNVDATENYSTHLPTEGPEIKQQAQSHATFQRGYVQRPSQEQIGQPVQTKFSNDDKAYDMSYGGKEEVDSQNGYDQNADMPPDVNTYKFADEVVEATEPVDVPEIPYPAEETTQKGDALENEYADVFSVGNKQETTNKLAEQDEFFTDAYAQSGFNLKKNQSDYNATESQYQLDDSYNVFADNGQIGLTENMTVADLQNQRRPKSLARKLITSGLALFIVVGGGYAATKYFMPSQENGTSTVIHADDEPFKVPAEQKSTDTDTQNNQDVYNHANGSDDSEKDNQDKLVDRSETPEDITALNNTPEGVDSYTDPSNVEDAIAAASNQTVPTREVQSVIVNPDGTISPSKSSHVDDMANSNETQAEKTNATQGATNTASKKPNAPSETENASTTESELTKIINDDAQTDSEGNNNAAATVGTTQNDISGLSSTTTPTVKQQTQPKQTADVASQQPTNPASKSVTSETPTKAKSETVAPMASVGAGGYYVQIASQPTRESAVESLNKAKSSFGSLIGSLPLSIEPASIPGKGTYYRVRVQVGPRDNAVSICDSIKRKNGNCFVGK